MAMAGNNNQSESSDEETMPWIILDRRRFGAGNLVGEQHFGPGLLERSGC
jgi:hypothetical protein